MKSLIMVKRREGLKRRGWRWRVFVELWRNVGLVIRDLWGNGTLGREGIVRRQGLEKFIAEAKAIFMAVG